MSKVLTRVGFDRLVERGGVKRVLDPSSYNASGILAKVVYYAIMLFVLSTAFGVFGSNPISDYLRAVIAYLPLVFVAIVIVVIAAAIAAGARNLIENSLGGLSYTRVLANLASGLILAIGVIAALDQLYIAAAVVNAVLYAVLAALVGIAVVAVGGGTSRPWPSGGRPFRPGTTRKSRESPGPCAAPLPFPAKPVRAPVTRSARTATAMPRPPVPSPGPMESGRTTAATDPGSQVGSVRWARTPLRQIMLSCEFTVRTAGRWCRA